jgi:hypothetical protein
MRTNCIVKLSKLQISELNTLVQKETSGDVEGNLLQDARSKFHIAFDLWTSPNKKAMNGVVAHFMDAEKRFQSILLALLPLVKSHEGGNIAESILGVVEMYGFEKKT